MKLWLWRRHRRFPRVVERPAAPRTIRVRPNRERWRAHDRRVLERAEQIQQRGALP